MTVDVLKLLAVLAGFAMIIAATILALRQAIQWQHVVVFCLGGVLAGISGVQLQAGKDNVSVNIGELAAATSQASTATGQQADALAALNTRVDQLQAAIQALHTASASPSSPQPDTTHLLALSNEARLSFNRYLLQSRTLSSSAATTSNRISLQALHK